MSLDPQVEQLLISAGIATPALKEEVANKVEATLTELEGALNAVRNEPLTLIRPEIDYDLKGRVAGNQSTRERGGKVLRKLREVVLISKAKRRIRRFIETGEHQARVYPTTDRRVFEYKVEHHVKSLFFKRTLLGRLKLVD